MGPWLLTGGVVLLANSTYLGLAAEPGLIHLLNLVAHPLLGVVLAVAGGRWWWQQRRQTGLTLAGTLLASSTACGVLLAVRGQQDSERLLVGLHVVLAVTGLAGLFLALRRTRLAIAVAAVALAVAMTPFAIRLGGDDTALWVNAEAPEDMAGEAMGGTSGPFFPSSLHTASGGTLPEEAFVDHQACARCHADEVRQWKASAHRFSSLSNPYYRRTVETFREDRGPVAAKWCGGCHDPALLVSGQLERPTEELADRPVADTGVSCTVCHGMSAIRSTMGQADFELAVPPLHQLATSDNRWLSGLHDLAVHLDPEPHRRAYRSVAASEELSAAVCSSCHKAHLDEPINSYRWLGVMDDYLPWQISSISGQGSRSAYYPERSSTCVDCHMPEIEATDGSGSQVRSHRFAAANTVTAALSGDPEQMSAVERTLSSESMSVDIFALRRDGDGAPVLTAPLDQPPAALRRGESVRLDIVVRSRGVGHNFPAGKADAVECWLEVQAVDDTGRLLFSSGATDDQGNVDPAAHFYGTLWVDAEGEALVHRDAWRARAVVYRRVVLPNTAEVASFRLEVPADAGDEVTLSAALNYRKASRELHRWVSERYPDAPAARTVRVAEQSLTLPVLDPEAPRSEVATPRPEDWERWNDYGIGLFFQGDVRGARGAFRRVTEIAPGYADGWLNVGRVTVAEGDLETSEEVLGRARELAPDLARVHFYLARLRRQQGDGTAALEHYRRVVELYPRDRIARRELAGVLFLNDDYEGVLRELRAVLEIDPEDAGAHFNLARAYRALGDADSAEQHQTRFERLRADESAQATARGFLDRNEHINRHLQAIHEHLNEVLPTTGQAAP